MPRWLLIVLGASGFVAVALGVLLSARRPAPVEARTADPLVIVASTAEPVAQGPQAAPAPDEEARRLGRYDKNDDGLVSRDEYLAARRKAYAKLDRNGDGVLQFEEYAVKTIDKFNSADGNGDARLTEAEFAVTATKRKSKPQPHCPQPRGEEEA